MPKDIKIHKRKHSEHSLSDELLDSFLHHRRRFVVDMGWFDETVINDIDKYDHHQGTISVIATTKKKIDKSSFIAGVRLTPVENLSEMMSLAMLGPDLQSGIADGHIKSLEEYAERGRLWDVTRLVTVPDSEIITKRHIGQAVTMILRTAMIESLLATRGKSPIWAFSTTRRIIGFLEKNKVPHTIIAQGVNDGDVDVTIMVEINIRSVVRSFASPKSLGSLYKVVLGKSTRRKNV